MYGDYRSFDKQEYFFATPASDALPDLKGVNLQTLESIKVASYSVCELPYSAIGWTETAQKDPPPENMRTIVGSRFPIGNPPYYQTHSIMHGVNVTCDLYEYNVSRDEATFIGNVFGHLRIASLEMREYMVRTKEPNSLYAYISPDISNVWYAPPDETRPHQPFMQIYDNMPLGGLVDNFCERHDKTQIIDVKMADKIGLANTIVKRTEDKDGNIISINWESTFNPRVDTTQTATPSGTNTIYRTARYLQATSNTWQFSNGAKMEPTTYTAPWYEIRNIVSQGTTPAMHALFVGRVVDGIDNGPIKVHISNMVYEVPEL
jgi:hypothetical protein